jgi:hypothetical protein
MNAAAEKIRPELASLSDAGRAESAHFLSQSLDRGVYVGAETAWDSELLRRAEEIRSGRAS